MRAAPFASRLLLPVWQDIGRKSGRAVCLHSTTAPVNVRGRITEATELTAQDSLASALTPVPASDQRQRLLPILRACSEWRLLADPVPCFVLVHSNTLRGGYRSRMTS